jgi:hypothetical protein
MRTVTQTMMLTTLTESKTMQDQLQLSLKDIIKDGKRGIILLSNLQEPTALA